MLGDEHPTPLCLTEYWQLNAAAQKQGRKQQAENRSNSLYRAPPSGKSAPDEENIFIRDEEPFGYHPQKGCYPDLYNHLFGRMSSCAVGLSGKEK